MSAAPDGGSQSAGHEPEPPTVVAPAVGGAGGQQAALDSTAEPAPAVSAETLLPGGGPSDPAVQGLGGPAPPDVPPQAGFAEPPPFVPTPPPPGVAPDAAESFSAVDAGLLERRPEVGLAAGFTGGFLLATILRRLGR